MLGKRLFLILMLLYSGMSISQNRQLIHVLKKKATEEQGTNKINILNDLVDELLLPQPTKENSKTAENYALEAADLSEKINYNLGMSRSFEQLALIYKTLNKFVLQSRWKKKAASIPSGLVLKQQLVELNKQREALAKLGTTIENQTTEINQKTSEINQKTSELDSTVERVEQLSIEKKLVLLENSLLQKEGLIKESEVDKQTLKSRFLTAILGVFLILSAILFLLFRSRSKLSKELVLKNKRIKKEIERSDELLLNILPLATANELKNTGKAETKNYKSVSIMFTDFKDFTLIAEKLSPKELVSEIDYCFSAFDEIVAKFGIEKIKTIGDAYLCAYGMNTTEQLDHSLVIKAAQEILLFMDNYLKEREAQGKLGFKIRIGVHTGPIVAGVVGKHKFAYDIWGDSVNTAARMEQNSEAGKINISATTYEMVKNDFKFVHRGKIMAKNKGEMDMFFIENEKLIKP